VCACVRVCVCASPHIIDFYLKFYWLKIYLFCINYYIIYIISRIFVRVFCRLFRFSRYRPNILQSTKILCFSQNIALCREKRRSNDLLGRRLLRVCTHAYNTGIKVCFLARLHQLGSRAANIRYYLAESDFWSCCTAFQPGYSCLPSSPLVAIEIVTANGTENFINLYIKRYSDDFDLNCYTDDGIWW